VSKSNWPGALLMVWFAFTGASIPFLFLGHYRAGAVVLAVANLLAHVRVSLLEEQLKETKHV